MFLKKTLRLTNASISFLQKGLFIMFFSLFFSVAATAQSCPEGWLYIPNQSSDDCDCFSPVTGECASLWGTIPTGGNNGYPPTPPSPSDNDPTNPNNPSINVGGPDATLNGCDEFPWFIRIFIPGCV